MYKRLVNESILAKCRVVFAGNDTKYAGILKRLLNKERGDLVRIPFPVPSGDIRQNIVLAGPDIIILDLTATPAADASLRNLKKISAIAHVPVIALCAHGTSNDVIVEAIENWYDDFLAQPVPARLLLARAMALYRLSLRAGRPELLLRAKGMVLNINEHTLTINGRSTDVTPKEFALLFTLMKLKGQALSRKFLIESIWQQKWLGDPRTLNKHVETLRSKIGKKYACMIKPVPGFGYRFSS